MSSRVALVARYSTGQYIKRSQNEINDRGLYIALET